MQPKIQSFALCVMLMLASASAHAAAFDFIGLFFSNGVTISKEGFEMPETSVEPGDSIAFLNEAAPSIRIVIPEMNVSTTPIRFANSARVTFTREGKFSVLCGKPCPTPLVVTVKREAN